MRAKEAATGPRFSVASGIPVFVEPSHALPLVDIEVILGRGALADPDGREGLTRMTARLMRRGPRGTKAEAFDETLDALGSTLGVTVGTEYVRFQGSVLRRNLEAYLALLGRILVRPALRADDFARLKRRSLAELVAVRDHDRVLAARAFRRGLFGKHPYGRPVTGTLDSLDAVSRAEVQAHHAALVRAGDAMIGVAGDVSEEALRPMLERAFADVPEGRVAKIRRRAPRARRGRRVIVVDKPQRSQTQLYVGTLGLKMGDPDHYALLVANTGFGGTFTSRLVKAVRSERGWSYGAGSRVMADRQREAWTMWTHPAAEQLVDCLRLELDLLDAWVARGLTGDEVKRSKRYLIKSHAFDLETAAKRLDPQLETAFYGLPSDWHGGFVRHVRGVSRADAHAAVKRHLSPDDLTIAMVATVDDRLLGSLSALPGVRSVSTVRYDEL
ncbi:MAG TPA: pitrilysin family protein [Sandaracinaceae bacterium LLY-WYZ-13_1]|nr:pitrilysin family protein [Sandaracinaceae bacterium LLY-WYZ-13_1]